MYGKLWAVLATRLGESKRHHLQSSLLAASVDLVHLVTAETALEMAPRRGTPLEPLSPFRVQQEEGTTWCWPWAPQLSHQRCPQREDVPIGGDPATVPGKDQERLSHRRVVRRVVRRVLLPAETSFLQRGLKFWPQIHSSFCFS